VPKLGVAEGVSGYGNFGTNSWHGPTKIGIDSWRGPAKTGSSSTIWVLTTFIFLPAFLILNLVPLFCILIPLSLKSCKIARSGLFHTQET